MIRKHLGALRLAIMAALGLGLSAGPLAGQTGEPARVATNARAIQSADLDALVAHALDVSPAVRAAAARLDAAAARTAPAGALPDLMLFAGIENLPLGQEQAGQAMGDPDLPDAMTMKMVGVAQTIPFPGKLGLRRRAAEHERSAAEGMLDAARLEVEREVKESYYELAFLDRALETLADNQTVLVNFIQVTESRYGVGVGGQQDVLKARVEAARLAEEAVMLNEQRRAALARLNAALDRPSDTPVEGPRVPERVARAAVAEAPSGIRFVSAALGARAADSPLRPLAELQDLAVRQNPDLRAHEAMIAAQAARVELARKEVLPDFDVTLQYGQRDGRPDMVSAMVSVPIPWQRGRKQDLMAEEAEAELAALQAEHHARVNALRARLAELYTELERARAQLALYAKSIIPQGRASLTSATTSFQVGRVDFLTLLENQATLYNYETAYNRGLTDFAKALAELEQVVGQEVL